MTTPHDKALSAFTEYFVRNYPGPDTVIFDPKWHAPKLFNAAVKAIRDAVEIGSAADLIADWLNDGTEDLPDDTSVRIEIGKRAIISDELGNLRAALHAPLPEAGNGDGWLPIETAPKDGTKIDVIEVNRFGAERVTDVWWSASRQYWAVWGDRGFGTSGETSVGVIPTHWRHRPSPPSILKEGAEG
ncbi:hypothetical protein RHSP_01139 [Rhizobium freirei PRF 81]|uniref:DUF551 domain-containing protein n=1 Tax=Rhizobium freirei PRF 81 TaxID=363754 RepID=N6V5L8_9HYPH|nr:hypothetical protein [Rhizobium freirei]ENN89110.1 hypothetical protein RHSP_01139 [Rhizobium freirei PRF 81]